MVTVIQSVRVGQQQNTIEHDVLAVEVPVPAPGHLSLSLVVVTPDRRVVAVDVKLSQQDWDLPIDLFTSVNITPALYWLSRAVAEQQQPQAAPPPAEGV